LDEIRRAPSLHRAERLRLERGAEPPESLVVSEDGLLEALGALAPEAAQRLRRRVVFDESARATAVKIAAGVALIAAVYFWGLPALASFIAPRVPASWEEDLGRGVVARAVPEALRCDEPQLRAAMDAILERLVQAVPQSPYRFTVTVADNPAINAFAAPGGYLVVNRGLLEATRTPEELAGVLAHEVQHVLQHHSMRAMAREIPLRIAIAAMFGGDGFGDLAGRFATTLAATRYQRADELEADREGLALLLAARVDPRGMTDFFGTLAREGRDAPRFATYLSSHPQTADRLAALRALAGQPTAPPVPLVPEISWEAISRSCTGP
jgi:predicted Zn-dependent protease